VHFFYYDHIRASHNGVSELVILSVSALSHSPLKSNKNNCRNLLSFMKLKGWGILSQPSLWQIYAFGIFVIHSPHMDCTSLQYD